MQILLAFASAQDAPAPFMPRVHQVEEAYAGRWSREPSRESLIAAHCGVVLWSGSDFSAWPAWVCRGPEAVVSLYAPIGYERVIPAEPLDTAPLRLAERVSEHPESWQKLCPPFVMCRLDERADRLTLWTDAVGIGRLFELRTEWGWVWSNRPEAALAFAGLPLRPDDATWAHITVADEAFGDATPYLGVRAVDAGAQIRWDGKARSLMTTTVDPVVAWSTPGRAESVDDLIDAAAEALTGVATSIGRLFDETPTVALTGGRDSRLVSAAFLAAGVDVELTTHDALPEDLLVACVLRDLLKNPPRHRVQHVASGTVAAPRPWEAVSNALAWHEFSEGLRPYSYLHYNAPEHIDPAPTLSVGGAGGEVAHGFFYPAGRDELEERPLLEMISRFTDDILRRYAPVPGPLPESRALVREQIHTSLLSIASRGFHDATMLDVFYLRQRLRRWGSTGERPGMISPLTSPDFIRACMGLAPEQRKANVLHREITNRLVPQWGEVPYYPAEYATSTGGRRPLAPRVIRVGDAIDRDAINSLIHDAPSWEGALDPKTVRELWEASIMGQTDPRSERILRAAIWRSTFTDRSAQLNGTPRPLRPLVRWQPPAPPEEAQTVSNVALDTLPPPPQTRRSALSRTARRIASTRGWARLRGTPVGRGLRAGARAARNRGFQL